MPLRVNKFARRQGKRPNKWLQVLSASEVTLLDMTRQIYQALACLQLLFEAPRALPQAQPKASLVNMEAR